MPADAAAQPVRGRTELYSRELLRLAASLPHADWLESPSGSATCRSPLCGSEISADVRIDAAGKVQALAFRARACAMGQASAAMLRTTGVGKTLQEIAAARDLLATALSGEASFAAAWPEHGVFEPASAHPGRHAAILLPYDALLAAVAG